MGHSPIFYKKKLFLFYMNILTANFIDFMYIKFLIFSDESIFE